MIPEMWPFFVVAKPFAPLTPEMAEKKPTPGESILNARSMLYLKSLALSGLPFEYFRFGRSVNFRSFPSAEIFGMLSARYGRSCAPAAPATWL